MTASAASAVSAVMASQSDASDTGMGSQQELSSNMAGDAGDEDLFAAGDAGGAGDEDLVAAVDSALAGDREGPTDEHVSDGSPPPVKRPGRCVFKSCLCMFLLRDFIW